MAKYRTKSPTIDAVQFTGGVYSAGLVDAWASSFGVKATRDPDRDELILRGGGAIIIGVAEKDDWVIREDAKLSVVKRAEFEETYEQLDLESNNAKKTPGSGASNSGQPSLTQVVD